MADTSNNNNNNGLDKQKPVQGGDRSEYFCDRNRVRQIQIETYNELPTPSPVRREIEARFAIANKDPNIKAGTWRQHKFRAKVQAKNTYYNQIAMSVERGRETPAARGHDPTITGAPRPLQTSTPGTEDQLAAQAQQASSRARTARVHGITSLHQRQMQRSLDRYMHESGRAHENSIAFEVAEAEREDYWRGHHVATRNGRVEQYTRDTPRPQMRFAPRAVNLEPRQIRLNDEQTDEEEEQVAPLPAAGMQESPERRRSVQPEPEMRPNQQTAPQEIVLSGVVQPFCNELFRVMAPLTQEETCTVKWLVQKGQLRSGFDLCLSLVTDNGVPTDESLKDVNALSLFTGNGVLTDESLKDDNGHFFGEFKRPNFRMRLGMVVKFVDQQVGELSDITNFDSLCRALCEARRNRAVGGSLPHPPSVPHGSTNDEDVENGDHNSVAASIPRVVTFESASAAGFEPLGEVKTVTSAQTNLDDGTTAAFSIRGGYMQPVDNPHLRDNKIPGGFVAGDPLRNNPEWWQQKASVRDLVNTLRGPGYINLMEDIDFAMAWSRVRSTQRLLKQLDPDVVVAMAIRAFPNSVTATSTASGINWAGLPTQRSAFKHFQQDGLWLVCSMADDELHQALKRLSHASVGKLAKSVLGVMLARFGSVVTGSPSQGELAKSLNKLKTNMQ